jgi:glycosyltransferase involved in cell wall biosynthesis
MKELKKQQNLLYPKVSIVTVVYNRARDLERTILSILNQNYPNLEYLVIDGGSTDGSVEIIKKYENDIAFWCSQKDNGIYDAMNKGVAHATGEWINFMNCGDTFKPGALKQFFDSVMDVDSEILYGDATMHFATFETLYPKAPLNEMWKTMPFCHQATFVRSPLMKKLKFDLKFKLSADFDFLYRAYTSGVKIEYINVLVCDFDFSEGASKNNQVRSILERRDSVVRENGSVKKRMYYFFLLIYVRLTVPLKKLLGESSTGWITKLLRT